MNMDTFYSFMGFLLSSVVSGFILIFLIAFIVIFVLNFFFFKYLFKEKKGDLLSILKRDLSVTSGWVISLVIGLMFYADFGNLVFGLTSFGLIFLATFLVSGKMTRLKAHEKVLYSLSLAVIMNPVWYFLLAY